MRLSLQGANVLERTALRLGLVPRAAAEAWAGMALSGILVAAVETGVFAELARRPAGAAELAETLGLDPLPTRLLLDCLRSTGYLGFTADKYRLRRAARRWLSPDSDLSVARYVAGTADYWSWWAGLGEATRTGRSTASHDVPAGDPYWQRYLTGQRDLARLSAAEVARKLRVPPGARSVLDVGGGHGWYSVELCRRTPGLTATVVDLPGSVAVGREIVAAAGLGDRVRFVEGDARTADLGGPYDVVLCFNLVHHLTPGEIGTLFGRLHDVLTPSGVLAVMDAFADPRRRASAAANFLGMFVFLSSGSQVHTPAQLREWLRAAGFASPRRVRVLRVPGLALYSARRPGTGVYQQDEATADLPVR
ncbi:methyltransferase [Cryptosporangium sp. NPDC051539]|uniref:methyltransferase n=1 Tax=Cryptosporangium sp. NPDC051539 TaxID=3363962 RepID=UPI0037B8AE00